VLLTVAVSNESVSCYLMLGDKKEIMEIQGYSYSV